MAISSQYPENTLTPLLASSNRRVDRFPDLAVITSHFNPCDYEMPRRNYLRFAAALRVQGVRLFTIELAFGSHPFFLQQSTDCIRLRTNHILWHKERLLNLMLDHVPGQFDKIAWVDADILFEDPNWVQSARDLLTNCLVVQLFSHATYLGKHGEPISSVQGVADRMGIMSFPEASDIGHPGFAWAARRDILSQCKLLDFEILGGADAGIVAAMYGDYEHPHANAGGPLLKKCLRRWMGSFFSLVRGNVGAIPSRIHHLWHGSSVNRQYLERRTWLAQNNFDPNSDIRLSASGTWEWTDRNPRLRDLVFNYFHQRREDA